MPQGQRSRIPKPPTSLTLQLFQVTWQRGKDTSIHFCSILIFKRTSLALTYQPAGFYYSWCWPSTQGRQGIRGQYLIPASLQCPRELVYLHLGMNIFRLWAQSNPAPNHMSGKWQSQDSNPEGTLGLPALPKPWGCSPAFTPQQEKVWKLL